MLEPHDDTSNGRVNDYPDLFRDVADELHTAGFNNEAVRFYETLYKCAFNYMGLRNLMGMYSAYVTINQPEKARDLLPVFREWEPETVQEMATLAKFFEDYDMEDEAMKWGEAVYKQGGARVLQKIGFQGYGELQEFFYQEKKRARGKYGVRKARIKKYTKHLRTATQNEDESEDDETGERPSLGPLTERPKAGLFRTRKTLGERPQTFLPDEIPGTNVPMGAIDHIVFKRKLNAIAEDYPEELKAARAQHREIVASFRRLQDLMQPAEEGKEPSLLEWMSIARELIEEFSTFDLFYYDRRKPFVGYFRRVGGRNELWNESALMVLAVAANNVEDGKNEPDIKEKPEKVPEDFYGIHFDRWVDVFAQYAVFLARQGEEERCFSTLEVAHQSNVVHLSQRHSHTLQLCRLACALALEDSPQGSVSLRWFMRTYPLNSDSFRLYSAISRLCSIPNGFATGPALKAFLRYIKTVDYTLLRADQRDGFNFRGEDFVNWIPKAVLEGVVKHVKDHDPALFALHGHVLMCGGSYMAALNYYFRAFAITPQDPVLNLSIGVAYIQHATKRLSENRQFQIQQGLAFVYRYHEIRTKDKIAGYCSEAEFNLGRIWHALGLVSQAIPAYERCISLSKRLREEPKQNGSCNDSNIDDFATEAAFAIQTIYALSGNFNGAWKVTKEALVIE
jgi:general transcription factor 3C polypeptide 3 (transcription factor C subunit 4)